MLHDINAQFYNGKVNLIIGQSGSGKTVLVKNIVGLFSPDSGEILYDGRDITQMDRKQIKELRKEIGMLFQGSALFDSETVLGNVMFPLKMFSSMSREEQLERAQFSDSDSCLELEHHCQRSQSVHKSLAVTEVVPCLLIDEYHLIFRIHLRAVLLLMDLTEHPLTVDIDLAEQILLHDFQLNGIIEYLSDYERRVVVIGLRHIVLAYQLVDPLIEFNLC